MLLQACYEFFRVSLLVSVKMQLSIFLNYFYLCVCVDVSVYLCHMCVGVSKRPGEGLRSPGARVMGCWEVRDVDAGNHTGVL